MHRGLGQPAPALGRALDESVTHRVRQITVRYRSSVTSGLIPRRQPIKLTAIPKVDSCGKCATLLMRRPPLAAYVAGAGSTVYSTRTSVLRNGPAPKYSMVMWALLGATAGTPATVGSMTSVARPLPSSVASNEAMP